MSEIEKKFSDFQKTECDPKTVTEEVTPRDPCPTCKPNPDWLLEKNWFEMETPWLDEKLCEYKNNFNNKSIPDVGQEWNLTDAESEYAVETSIVAILNEFGKKNTKENRDELKKVADLVKYADPLRDISQTLVSIPAFNVDILEEDPMTDEDEDKTPASEIELYGAKLYSQIFRLRAALKTYNFYYSVFHQIQGSIIHEEGHPLNKINYTDTQILLKEFLSDFNKILTKNRYEKLRAFPRSSFGIFKTLKKIKIVFDETSDTPYVLKEILVNSKNGCDEYDKLKNIDKLKNYTAIMPFLAKIEDVIIDITAQQTKPWLEFTLEYFYPKMVVDYGLDTGDMLEEQKQALACLLEDELGIGGGKGLDSLVSNIMSAADIFSYEEAKKGCRDTDQIKEGSGQATKDKKAAEDMGYREYRKEEMIKRMQKKHYKEALNEKKEEYEQAELEQTGLDPKLTNDQVLRLYRDEVRAYQGPSATGEDFSSVQTSQIKEWMMADALNKAHTEFQENNENKKWASNSPWLADAKEAALEKYKKEDTVLDALKENVKNLGDIDDFYDFIGIFGVCGISKLSGMGIKCLSGGLTLDQFYDAAISQIFKYMELTVFDKLWQGVPANIKREVDEIIQKEFGEVSFTELLGFTKEQHPEANLWFISGDTQSEIDRAVEVIEKYPYPTIEAMGEAKFEQYRWLIITTISEDGHWPWGKPNYEGGDEESAGELMDKYYNYTQKSFRPTLPLSSTGIPAGEPDVRAQNKTKKDLKRMIRRLLRTRDKDQLSAAKQQFNSLFSKDDNAAKDDIITSISETTETQEIQLLDTAAWESTHPGSLIIPTYEESFSEALLSSANDTWHEHRQTNGASKSDRCRLKWWEYAAIFKKGLSINAFGTWWQSSKSTFESEGGHGNIDQSVALLQKQIDEEKTRQTTLYNEQVTEWEETKSDYVTAGTQEVQTTRGLSEEEKNQAIKDARSIAFEERLVAKRSMLGTSEYEQAVKDYEETNLGIKINKLVSAVFVELVESLIGVMPSDDLWEFLRQFPIPDMVLNVLEGLLKPCPHPPLFFPPPSKFLNTLKIDVCDPTIQVIWPKLVVPSLDYKSNLKEKFRNEMREKLIELYTETLTKMLFKILDLLEGALCKAMETLGAMSVDLLSGNASVGSAWYKALDEAFCGGDRDKSEALNKEIFNKNRDMAAMAANIISGVSTTDEILEAIIAEDNTEQNVHFNERVANAINSLAPELSSMLGSPSLVAMAMAAVGSNLSPSDRQRIRDLLDEKIPNLPISSAICLTDDQLDEWNKLREQLLRDKGLSPADARAQINQLNTMTQQALSDMLGIAASLDSEAGPFLGPAQDFYTPSSDTGGLFDDGTDPADLPGGGIDEVYGQDPPCQDLTDGAMGDDDLEKTDAEEQSSRELEMLIKYVKNSYFNKGGIFSEALRDTEDKNLFGHSLRVKSRFLWPNYANSEEEREVKYEDGGAILKFIMDAAVVDDGSGTKSRGSFPETVGAKMREELLAKNVAINLNNSYETEPVEPHPIYGFPESKPPSLAFSDISMRPQQVSNDLSPNNNNLSISYINDQTENESRRRRGYYEYSVNTTFHPNNDKTFSYYSSIISKTSIEGAYDKEFSTTIMVEPTEEEVDLLNSVGVQYPTGDYKNVRRSFFDKFLNTQYSPIFGTLNYNNLYASSLQQITNMIKETAVTDPRDDFTYGFKFGYTPEVLTEEDFDTYTGPDGEEYTYSEQQKILGKYANDRIVVLSPDLYGGRYSNPPFWIKPMQHQGWLDATEAIFGGAEGCEPKTVGALSFKDIQERGDKVKSSLTPDPRLSLDQDCVSLRPFNHLCLKEAHAGIESNVRTTIRTYSVEEFLKGMGPLSNIMYNEKNYDQTVCGYIVERMRSIMMDLGNARSSKKIRIKRRNYWYTFLEQCVQTYQRMIDIDGIKPPAHVLRALEDIGALQKEYIYPTKKLRRKHFNKNYALQLSFDEPFYEKDNPNSYNFTNLRKFLHDAIAFRVYGDDMFSSDDTLENFGWKRWYKLKKIRFFAKIFAIRVVENQCKTILMELVKSEMRMISKRFDTSASTGAYYRDMEKAIFGSNKIFPKTNLTVGTIVNTPGDVPAVPDNVLQTIGEEGKPIFIIEKYLKIEEREDQSSVPDFIRNRQNQYKGIMNPAKFKEFINSLPGEVLVNPDGNPMKISDCFGNLEFVYEWSIKEVLEHIIGSSTIGRQNGSKPPVERLKELNIENSRVGLAIMSHTMLREYEDFKVKVTKDLIPPELLSLQTMTPIDVIGKSGFYHGLRVSVITPKGSLLKKISAKDLTDALKLGLTNGERSGINISELSSSLRGLAGLLADYSSELLGLTTDLVANLDEGLESMTEILTEATAGQENVDVGELDETLRELSNGLGVDIGNIPHIGTWVNSSLVPLTNIEEKLDMSEMSKTFLFDDGNFVLPLISSEYELLDSDLSSFKGVDYDLECLVNKMTADPLYSLMFEKVFCTKMITSMAATYCMFGFMPAQGFGVTERTEVDSDPGETDYFDGRHNRKLKQFLRKQFSSLYLSNDVDGQHPDDDDESDLEMRFDNPFRGLELAMNLPKIKGWRKRRIKSNPYDANGVECVDPLKDLM